MSRPQLSDDRTGLHRRPTGPLRRWRAVLVLASLLGLATAPTTALARPFVDRSPTSISDSADTAISASDGGAGDFSSVDASAPSSSTTAANPAAPAPAPAEASPVATVSAASSSSTCTLGAKLVPTCGLLWGAAPAAFSSEARATTLAAYEADQGRPLDVYHGYHVNDQPFPNASERAIALDPAKPRLLLLNWRPAMDMTWAQAAAGGADARIDAEARVLKAFPAKVFVAIWAEGEHFVKPTAGSGMTATDYRDMSRHVISRLKAGGATNAVFVQIFQGYPAYAVQPWWPSMYPGDDVIDWIACDSYNSGNASGYGAGDFSLLVNRVKGSWQGWYHWATTQHPTKPLMLAEWGIWYQSASPTRMATFYDQVRTQLPQYPRIKAMLYFNTANHPKGTTAIDTNSASLAAYRRLTASIPRVDLSNR